jgi:single-strand DNA-binding protein
MANLNKVFLIGNLTRDPELRYTPGGTGVANLGVAVNRRYKDSSGELKEEVCFLTVTVWDKQAEACCQHLQKGSPVFVEGVLQSRFWKLLMVRKEVRLMCVRSGYNFWGLTVALRIKMPLRRML